MNNRFYLSLIFGFFIALNAVAQEEEERQGEIEDVQVEIIKDREIDLPPAVRKFDKIPPQEQEPQRPMFKYAYPMPTTDFTPLDLRLRPLRIKDEPLQKTYGNYIAAGFGNFTTPYLEAYVNSKREQDHSFGAHAKYLASMKGPVDGENSGNSELQADVFGTYYGPKASLSGDLGYRRRGLNFYGYPQGTEGIDEDSISQHFNHVFAEAIFKNTDSKALLDYEFRVHGDYISDKLDMNEVLAGFDWRNFYELSEDAGLMLDLSYDYINYSNQLVNSQNRHLLKVKPRLKFKLMNLSVIAGFNAAYENDTLGTEDDLHFYPYADVNYQINDQWKVFALLKGDMVRNSYSNLSYENPWLGPENLMFHSNQTFSLNAGLKSRINQQMAWRGGVAYEIVDNMPFYINSNTQPALDFYNKSDGATGYFSIIYNTSSTKIFSLFTELSLISDENLYSNLRARYNSYNTGDLEEAYHRPEWLVEADVFYQLVEKINIGLNFYGMGGISAIDEFGDNFKLDPALDLNVKLDYLLSDRASIFVNLNNVFSQNYELLNRYPVRGFQAIGGLTYNF
ncbi:MAG: hypothetical protein ACNS60_18725 [Candidatus Cyclobacteriaceae bacterium M2_1C_046]